MAPAGARRALALNALVLFCFASLPPPATLSALCPPLLSASVQVKCTLNGSPANCSQPVSPGTKASFSCKPLHQFLFGFLPAGGYESVCGPSGEWSVRPFRCVPICGRPTGKPTAFVRDGERVSSSADYPWHVTIYQNFKGEKKQICGGSLITAKYFISAAHCFHDNVKPLPPSNYIAALSKIRRSIDVAEPNTQFREIIKIHMKDYGARKLQYANDIALVELANEVDVTAWALPVCVDWGLDLPDLRHGENGTVVGFGNTAVETNEELNFARLPFVRGDECKKRASDKLAIFTVLPDKFCVGFFNNTSVGPGDSGGGLAFPDEDRVWYLRGVVSVGSSQETTYSYFTNVTAFIPWVSGIIREGELSGRRCGVDVSEAAAVDGAKAERQDFPWEVDVYRKKTSNRPFERLWSGVLVQPNLVITAVLHLPTIERQVDLSEYPASWIRVATRGSSNSWDLDKAGNVSDVIRIFYPEDVLYTSGFTYNFILLELKQPLHLMPVCLDWTGGALLQKRETATTFLEDINNHTRSWRRYSIIGPDKCKDMLSAPPPEEYNLCTFQEGPEPVPSRALLVNVDNTWFLRAVWSHTRPFDTGTVALYTDLADPGVRKWLSKTRDMLGKPTCGDIQLCQPMSLGLSLPGHMPWTVAVVYKSADGHTQIKGSGLLVQPNAVITDYRHVVNTTAWDEQSDETPPILSIDTLSILWTDQDGNIKTSSVVGVSVHRSQLIDKDGNARFDVALLELHSKQAVFSTPVCLDLSGNYLSNLKPGQLGLAETWSTFGARNKSYHSHSLVSLPHLPLGQCGDLTQTASKSGRNQFCTTAEKDSIGNKALGGGYLISTGSKWFVQGLYSQVVKLRRSSLILAADLTDDELRNWLRKKLDRLPTVQSELPDTGPKNCEGGRQAVTECGIFVPQDELSSETEVSDAPSDYFLHKQTSGHMEWNVDVHVDVGAVDGHWEVRAGVVVKPKMVLTDAHGLVNYPSSNGPASARIKNTNDVIVKYLSADKRDRRIVEVEHIHVRERTKGSPTAFRYDMALLQLKTAVSIISVCVPAPSWVGNLVKPLAMGTTGLVETWADVITTWRFLLPTHFLSTEECSKRLPEVDRVHFPSDQFCAEPLREATEFSKLGAAFVVLFEGAWYLRGIQGVTWSEEVAVYAPANSTVNSFFNLDDPELLLWLVLKMGGGEQNATSSHPTARPPTTITTGRPPPVRAPTEAPVPDECGQTAWPLNHLPANGSKPGHLPWSVGVTQPRTDGVDGLTITAGVLVRPDVALTAGQVLVVPNNKWNDTGVVRTKDPSRLRVVWFDPSGRWKRLEVESVHVHERDLGPREDAVPFDVGLLRLKTPVRSALICLDLHPSQGPLLASGSSGVVETWLGDFFEQRRFLVSVPFLSTEECRAVLAPPGGPVLVPADRITTDRFCSGPIVGHTIFDGAGILTRKGDSWFLRGLNSFSWGVPAAPSGIVDFADASLLHWLQQHLDEPDEPSVPTKQTIALAKPVVPKKTVAPGTKVSSTTDHSASLYFQD